MVDAWPGTVSLYAQSGQYGETPDRNVSTFQPDRGTPLEYRSTSVSSDQIQFTTQMSYEDFQTLVSFYRDTLKDGVLPFTRPHPQNVTGPSVTFKFMAAPAYTDIENAFDLGNVALNLRRMP